MRGTLRWFAGVLGAIVALVLSSPAGHPASLAPHDAGPGSAIAPVTAATSDAAVRVLAEAEGGRRVLFGASTPPGVRDLTGLDAFEQAAGRRAAVFNFYAGWAIPRDRFHPAAMAAVAARGTIPMVTWEPWDFRKGTVDQPDYSLARIGAGAYDDLIRRWAYAAKRYGGPIFLRFAHEMNGRFYPWCEGVNGNGPGSYVRAWRHVYDVVASVGADNVRWVWAPNVEYAHTTPFRELYPGDAYVDWVGLDGYNGGTALPWGGWHSFDQIFASSIRDLRAVAPDKPIMISEVASTEKGGSKAAWIRDFFDSLAHRQNVRAFVWFNWSKETDWRIQSSPEAEQAFATGVADPRYGG
jgi:hypothetical protein